MTLTDRKLALESLRANVERNCEGRTEIHVSGERATACGEDVQVAELEWGSDLLDSFDDVNVVLGADIVYIEETFPLLLKTLLDVTRRNEACVVLLSCKIRYEKDEQFIDLLRKHFTVEQIFYDDARDIRIYKAVLLQH